MCVYAGLPVTGISPPLFMKEKNQTSREALDPKLSASRNGSGRPGSLRWAWGRGRGQAAGEGREGGKEEDLVVDCCCCLGFPPSGEVFVSIESERDNSGRTQPGARARSPPPQPRHLGPWPAWRPPSPRDGPPCAWTPSGRGCRLAPHRAWPCIVAPAATRGRLGAQPHIARPTVQLPACNPTVSRLSFLFLFPSFFVVMANLGFLSSLFPSFLFFFFFFLLQREGSGGGGVA